MPAARAAPDELTYLATMRTISVCGKNGQWQLALGLLGHMRQLRLKPTEVTYSAVLSAIEKSNAWEAALAVLEEMLQMQLVPNGLNAGAVAGVLQRALSVDSAYIILDKLLGLWVQPEKPQLTSGIVGLLPDENDNNNNDNDNNNINEPAEPDLAYAVKTGAGVMAIVKPIGMTTEAATKQVLSTLPQEASALHVVSRLDHPTSGVFVAALGLPGSAAANWLEAQFSGRLVQKEYVCLCEGGSLGPVGSRGDIASPLRTLDFSEAGVLSSRTEVSPSGREALTEYEVLAGYRLPGTDHVAPDSEFVLLKVRPLTGRTHQIRVHLASIGRPLVGDLTYGAKKASALASCPRLFLHCGRVALRTMDGQPFVAEAELPPELSEVLVNLQPVTIQNANSEANLQPVRIQADQYLEVGY
ncbi:unnamed protein product [Polarella glacialis]|nr:unnamed protein product [Polarella glacialis]